ncbi:uncharacterized protein YraI [Amycolatopsis bartoniae]|nr:hypothetical protein [Amycolatopsis bartoniae]MBB2939553.1 uncharacterized protein YraI [Amycolatopsis bartoniae]TVT00026.1 hypothetical protein FNH07_32775 [Amycolatopsis bartoniae]
MTRAQIRRTAGRTAAVVVAAAGVLLAGALPAGAAVSGTVQTAGDPLTVRRAPSTSATAVRTVANGTTVAIDCQTTGTSVAGPLGTTTLWDYVPALGGYLSDGYVKTGSDGRVAPDCGVGSGSAECSSGSCAGEGQFRASDAHFLVYDKEADGKSAVVAYWLAGGAGPFYAWNSGGSGTNTDRATGAGSGDWIYYKVCVADYSATPTLQNCSGGLTDYAA